MRIEIEFEPKFKIGDKLYLAGCGFVEEVVVDCVYIKTNGAIPCMGKRCTGSGDQLTLLYGAHARFFDIILGEMTQNSRLITFDEIDVFFRAKQEAVAACKQNLLKEWDEKIAQMTRETERMDKGAAYKRERLEEAIQDSYVVRENLEESESKVAAWIAEEQ